MMLNLEQGSQEWLDFRSNHITATDASIILGTNPYCTREELMQRKLGLLPEVKMNAAMRRGSAMEPAARVAASDYLHMTFTPVVLQSDSHPWAMASLDGISPEGVVIEIKCPGKKNHEAAKRGAIPEYYYPQLHHQMWVAEANSVWYWSWDGSAGVAIQVERCQEYIDWIIRMEEEFYRELLRQKQALLNKVLEPLPINTAIF